MAGRAVCLDRSRSGADGRLRRCWSGCCWFGYSLATSLAYKAKPDCNSSILKTLANWLSISTRELGLALARRAVVWAILRRSGGMECSPPGLRGELCKHWWCWLAVPRGWASKAARRRGPQGVARRYPISCHATPGAIWGPVAPTSYELGPYFGLTLPGVGGGPSYQRYELKWVIDTGWGP